MEMAACENEILKAMASGIAKKTSNQIYGTAITSQREPGNLRLMDLSPLLMRLTPLQSFLPNLSKQNHSR